MMFKFFSLVIVLCLLFFIEITNASQYLEIPWSNTYYGPDGPWQAVSVAIGGSEAERSNISQCQSTVDLLPGGFWSSNVLSEGACASEVHQCGTGQPWTPNSKTNTDWKTTWTDLSQGLESRTSFVYPLAMTINQQTIYNVSLAAVTNVSVKSPNGEPHLPVLGSLALGNDLDEMQRLTAVGGKDAVDTPTWTFAGGAFHRKIIPSYSYGLHIGSAAFNYAGSLVFGGYDKARVLGPYTTFTDPPTLLDIGIGVEIGESPFVFNNKSGLLLSKNNRYEQITVIPDPQTPYLSLPTETCEAIIEELPIFYDSNTKYYLWDRNDPRYEK
ncbi:uncharacterized protein K452DRAFT_311373 [Aplosporella prunicola CBS 121167]|uniref:Peptidase A1 domain-containing protein n=1 Tax=Aplosporella prunicola CBS 121167 TaxID=1176127 RepID=A0A6A6B6K6_9PEZI|nr:uncharacterized protein K452DRAFT_311373 [Aplosporella prunicola CBS 121167]KAF2138421.1 hypothetical protein K452DRAFT_311373 [Aplosporella prunicola CBS 121167]